MRITAKINGTEHVLDVDIPYSDDDEAVAGVASEFSCRISGEKIVSGVYRFIRAGINTGGDLVFSATLTTPDPMLHRVDPQPQLALT